nr:integrase, catalytic region, zinc finger, CCHC-type, peptidase aspartic, catalytic [Tanacetum cinerariifolium]
MKSVTACKDILNSRTLNANAVCATCNKCLVDSNHFACVTKMLNDVNARTKKPNIVPISTRKPKSQANKSVATSHKKKVASKSNNQKPQSYFRMMYEKTRNVTINRVYYVESLNHNIFSVGQFYDADLEVAFRKSTCFVKDLQGNDLLTDAHVPSQQELDLLFGPLYDEYFNACSNPQEKQPSMNIQSTSAPSTQTYVHAEENTNHQAEEGEHLQDDEFTNPFCAPAQEAESSSHNIGNSNLATDPKICMYALTVSTAEPKNIEEEMADSAWMEAMQEELH